MPRTSAKQDWYIAIPVDENEKGTGADPRLAIWDMLRYDRCHPYCTPGTNGVPGGYIVLVQPHRKDVPGGFTLDRWASFGFRDVITDSGPVGEGMPYAMLAKIRSHYETRERRKRIRQDVTEYVSVEPHQLEVRADPLRAPNEYAVRAEVRVPPGNDGTFYFMWTPRGADALARLAELSEAGYKAWPVQRPRSRDDMQRALDMQRASDMQRAIAEGLVALPGGRLAPPR